MVAGGAATQSAEIAQAVTADGTNPLFVSFGAIPSLPLSRQIRITNLGSGWPGSGQDMRIDAIARLTLNGNKWTALTTRLVMP
jgi:hypothetical protein